MSTPVFTPSKSPVKNIEILLRYLRVTISLRPSFEQLLVSALMRLVSLVESPTLLKVVAPNALINVATAGAGTFTAAQLLNGLITRDCAGGARTDTTDTAAAIIAALGLTADYDERYCAIHNLSAGNFTSTLAGGTGVTLKGAITVEQNTVIWIAITRTSGTTVSIRQV